MDLSQAVKNLSTKLARAEASRRAVLETRRHVLLQELASVEKQLEQKPTTAQIREWYRQVNRL